MYHELDWPTICKFEPGCLADYTTNIYFDDDFNELIKPGCFTNNVKCIGFGSSFNQPLNDGVLPPFLEKLEFGYDGGLPSIFNQSKENIILPPSIIYVRIDYDFIYKDTEEFNKRFTIKQPNIKNAYS